MPSDPSTWNSNAGPTPIDDLDTMLAAIDRLEAEPPRQPTFLVSQARYNRGKAMMDAGDTQAALDYLAAGAEILY